MTKRKGPDPEAGEEYHYEGEKRGPKEVFRPSVVATAELIAKGGHNYKEIAAVLGIHRATLYRWMDRHPELRDSIYRGHLQAAGALLSEAIKRAMGYEYEEEKLTPIGEKVSVLQHMPGDGNLAFKLLKNLDPEKFRDTQQIDHKGSIPVQIMPEDTEL